MIPVSFEYLVVVFHVNCGDNFLINAASGENCTGA